MDYDLGCGCLKWSKIAEKLVFSLVLNFLSRSLREGVKLDLIIKSAINYFEYNAVLQAKKTLCCELDIQTRVVLYFKDDDNMTDMCKLLVIAAKQNVLILKFVIFIPCEVPTIGICSCHSSFESKRTFKKIRQI